MQASEFIHIVDNTPLVSIDLIVRNPQRQILLGLRNNRPAQNTWFVPGGRILKDETLDAAFARIVQKELGLALDRMDAAFIGVYEHFYRDNFAGVEGVTTHYVVLAHAVTLDVSQQIRADDQHASLEWMSENEILANGQVHQNTRAYFIK